MSNFLPTDKRHCDRVSILAIDKNGISYDAFPYKTNPLVKRDRPCIVGMHVKFDAYKACVERAFQSLVEKPRPEATTSIGGNYPHAEGPTMSMRGEEMPANVAPPNDFVFCQSNELRITTFDVLQNEFAGLRQREGFEKREEFPLTSNRVEGAVKALDVFGRYRHYARVRRDTHLLWGTHATIVTKIAGGGYSRRRPSSVSQNPSFSAKSPVVRVAAL
jgi:hypothetical protein